MMPCRGGPNLACQVGAAVGSLCEPATRGERNQRVQCASLKSNVGHMEACAAAAGLASLALAALETCIVAANARLIRSVGARVWPLFEVRLAQVERAPVLDGIVTIRDARRACGAIDRGRRRWPGRKSVPTELVWVQRDYSARGSCSPWVTSPPRVACDIV